MRSSSVFFFVVVGLTLVGLVLVLTATVTIPHTVQESFSEFKSGDETREFYPSTYPLGPVAFPNYEHNESWPADSNGSLNTNQLDPMSKTVFVWNNFFYLSGNESLFEINVSSTNANMSLSIVGLQNPNLQGTGSPPYWLTVAETFLNVSWVNLGSYQNDSSLTQWNTFYWTPPFNGSIQENGGFLFQNLSNQTASFSFKVTDYYTDTVTGKITTYSTLIDSNYSYVGVFLVAVAILIETYFVMYRRTDEESE